MSFSGEVKEEIAKSSAKARHCQIAELAAIVSFECSVERESGVLRCESENPLVQEKYAHLLYRLFEIDENQPMTREQTQMVLVTLKMYAAVIRGSRVDGMIYQNMCCKRAFIRGAFLAAGSISDPNKSYHLEIVCLTKEQAESLCEMLAYFETDAKIVLRKNHYVVYLKDASQIVDVLNVMEAYVSLMKLENIRIVKEVRNTVNRKVNCETANISKTVNAASRQIDDIMYIRDTMGFDELPENLRQMAELRLEYPESPLKELGNLLDPPVGKSGVNHRLRKLSQLAEDLRGE